MCKPQGYKVTQNMREEGRDGGLQGRISSSGWQEVQKEMRNETTFAQNCRNALHANLKKRKWVITDVRACLLPPHSSLWGSLVTSPQRNLPQFAGTTEPTNCSPKSFAGKRQGSAPSLGSNLSNTVWFSVGWGGGVTLGLLPVLKIKCKAGLECRKLNIVSPNSWKV